MLKLLSDENFNNDLVRALLLQHPARDIVRVQDVGLAGTDDDAVLAWVAAESRIVLTHDRATLPDFAYQRVSTGAAMPGVIVVNDRAQLRQTVEDLQIISTCGAAEDLNCRVLYLPL